MAEDLHIVRILLEAEESFHVLLAHQKGKVPAFVFRADQPAAAFGQEIQPSAAFLKIGQRMLDLEIIRRPAADGAFRRKVRKA